MSAERERFVLAAGERANGAVGARRAGGRPRGAAQQQTSAPGQELGGPAAPSEPLREGGREGRREG